MHAVVVGSGIAGLSAAYSLSRHGAAVTIVESAEHIGGKLRVSDVDGIAVDEGAEQLLQRVPDGVALARDAGLGPDLTVPARSGAGLVVRGALRPLPSRTVLGIPSSLGSVRDVLTQVELARAAADLLLPARSVDDDMSVQEFVGRRLGRAVVDRLVEPLLGGVYAGRPELLSAQATLPPQLTSARGSLLRAVHRMTTASADATPVFAGIGGGLGRLPDAVLRASGAELVRRRTVRRIERLASGWRVVHGPATDERALDCDAVVVAVPAAPAARLLADVAPVAVAELAAIDYASMAIVTTVWQDVDVPPGTGYLVPAVERRPVKAVTFTSAKWGLETGGRQVVRCSIGRHGEVAELQRDDDDLVELAVEELRERLGFAGRPVASRLSRWGGGLPQYAVGHVDRVRRIRDAVAVVPGLAVCGAAYDGVGVPACIRSGRAAAEQLLPATPSQPR